MSTNGELGHDALSVKKQSSSRPGTPKTPSFPDSLPTAKRRRTQKSLGADDQVIQMNGHRNGDSNGFIDDSVSTTAADSNDRREPLHGVAAPINRKSEVVQKPEIPSSKAPRGARTSNETSRRIIKLKTGTGAVQQTIQTFIFKASRDPRASLPAQTPGPSFPTEDGTQTVRSEPGNLDSSHGNTKPGRRSIGTDDKKGSGRIIKFKNYFQTSTPNNRSARKSARIDQHQDSATKTTPSLRAAPKSVPRSRSASKVLTESENAGSQRPKFEKTESALVTPSHSTPNENAIVTDSTPGGQVDISSTNEASDSVQRRSGRIRKPVGSYDPAKQELLDSAKRSIASKPKLAKGQQVTRKTSSDVDSSAVAPTPKTPVPVGFSQSFGEDSVDGAEQASGKRAGSHDKFVTPSPESLLTTARTSGRLRKPTIQAIEALQQRPKTRKRKFEEQSQPSTSEPSFSLGDQSQDTSVSVTPTRQSEVTPIPEAVEPPLPEDDLQKSKAENEFLARQLYELACAAASDSPEEDVNIDKLREEFHAERQRTEKATLTAVGEVPSNSAETEQPPISGESGLLDHPNESRPWTDSDGWTHTGRLNEHNEEIVLVPDTYVWVRQYSHYGNSFLGPAPPMVKSRQQVERDQVFGFPPMLGQRNLPRMGPQRFLREDVGNETAKIKAREAAAQKGLSINRSMSLSDIQERIREHDYPGSSKANRPLRLVFVDSRKLSQSGVSLRSQDLRRRRSAPVLVEAKKGQNETPRSRKRQLEEPSTADMESKKRRRSTLNPINNSEAKTPTRQSLGKAKSDSAGRLGKSKTPASTKATPKSRQNSLMRTVQSEKVDKSKAASSTPASGKRKSVDAPAAAGESPSTEGRPRRRAAAALMAQFEGQSDSKVRRASTGLKQSKSTPNLSKKRKSTGNADEVSNT
jgi:hypothetical protein